MRHRIEQLLICLLACLACVAIASCSRPLADRATVFTEMGFTAAEQQWDAVYWERLRYCRSVAAPRTPEAEQCFGAYVAADTKVETAVRTAVALLRAYWTARAAGKQPDWRVVADRVAGIVRDLPPEARQYFEWIQGI